MVDDKSRLEKHREKMNRPGKWVYIAPVSGVRLSEDVSNEFGIKRVLLITKDKLPRVRKRLGFPRTLSQMSERHGESFSSSDVFAIVRQAGIPQETKTICRRIVQNELHILALSQLGYMKRRLGSYPSIQGLPASSWTSDILLNTEDARLMSQNKLIGKDDTLLLDQRWKNYHKEAFFIKLLEVLNNKTDVASSWRDELERAAILVGQSQCSSDVAQSFLWNMIALEVLLTRQGDKYTDALPMRVEAFLGWVSHWEVDGYLESIQELYRKRCAFVHNGKREDITIADLLFTDDLLLNLLSNLMRHISVFRSKNDVIEFSKKVEAEHVLGIRSKVRPKTLRFFSRTYKDKDYEEI